MIYPTVATTPQPAVVSAWKPGDSEKRKDREFDEKLQDGVCPKCGKAAWFDEFRSTNPKTGEVKRVTIIRCKDRHGRKACKNVERKEFETMGQDENITNPENPAKVVELRKKGKNYGDIAKALGIPKPMVADLAKVTGFDRKGLVKWRIKRIRELAADGKTGMKISKILSIHYTDVYKYAKRHDITLPNGYGKRKEPQPPQLPPAIKPDPPEEALTPGKHVPNELPDRKQNGGIAIDRRQMTPYEPPTIKVKEEKKIRPGVYVNESPADCHCEERSDVAISPQPAAPPIPKNISEAIRVFVETVYKLPTEQFFKLENPEKFAISNLQIYYEKNLKEV